MSNRQYCGESKAMTMSIRAWLFFLVTLFLSVSAAFAQDLKFFRIGTGATSGTYFVIGGMIANAVSSPPGSRPCGDGGGCGVPNLIAVAQSTEGTIANLQLLKKGEIESALVQADLATLAFTGKAPFTSKTAVKDLRLIATLYPDMMHIIVPKDSKIKSIKDLRGKRIALGELNSGSAATAKLILSASGLAPTSYKAVYGKIDKAIAGLSSQKPAQKIAAMVVVGGYPQPAVQELARSIPVRLLSIDEKTLAALNKKHPFYQSAIIPKDTYVGVEATQTVALQALWVASSAVPSETIYGITKALWSNPTQTLLKQGHPQAKIISFENAVGTTAIPLHEGAAKFYGEQAEKSKGVKK
jgi:TRAP transporter TAXI family solute receptor